MFCSTDSLQRHNPQPSPGISLRRLLPESKILKSSDLWIRSCCGNWQEAHPDDLYVAMVNTDHDGHDDANLAVQRGATAVLGERMLPVPTPQCIVPDSRIAYGKICHALAGDPSSHLETIGVSGTDGKTTTAHLIQSILETAGLTSGLSSSLCQTHPAGEAHDKSGGCRLAAPQLAQTVANMAVHGNRFAILESASTSLAQHHLAGIELDVAVLTNIRGSHFQFHGTLANYRRAQLRMLDYLKPTGLAILNADDPASYQILDQLETPALTIGVEQAAEVEGSRVQSNLNEQIFLISAGSQCATVRTRILGKHHIYNCLAAAAVALTYDIDLPTIARGIERIETLPGRLESICCGQAAFVAIDQSATPYRLGVALSTLRKHCRGRVICVFSCDPHETPQSAGQFGRIAERNSHLPVITLNRHGKNVNYEPAHRILDGFNKPQKAQLIPDRIAAVEWALQQAGPEDAVLIAGRGEKPFATLSGDCWQLTDRDVCESWLYGESKLAVPPASPNGPQIFRIDDYRQI